MRIPAVGIGSLVLFTAFHPSVAVEPQAEDNVLVAREVAELQQRVEELSAQIKRLEQQLEHKQVAPHAQVYLMIYNVSDIVPEIHGDFAVAYNFDHLIHYITTKIAPRQWDEAGGPGSIAAYPQNMSLVISQTAEVHEEIQQWMERLRQAQRVLDEFHATEPPRRAANEAAAPQ